MAMESGKRFDQPILALLPGAPIGFQATEQWIQEACAFFAKDPAPALASIRKASQQAHLALSRFNTLTGLPRGATFAIRADGSLALPLTRWLYEYLGMVPIRVQTEEALPEQKQQLLDFLKNVDCEEAWTNPAAKRLPDVVFGGEGYIGEYRAPGEPVAGVDIALPSRGTMEILPRSLLGHKGALWLLERVLNGLLTGD